RRSSSWPNTVEAAPFQGRGPSICGGPAPRRSNPVAPSRDQSLTAPQGVGRRVCPHSTYASIRPTRPDGLRPGGLPFGPLRFLRPSTLTPHHVCVRRGWSFLTPSC